jgi:hypothetical protein
MEAKKRVRAQENGRSEVEVPGTIERTMEMVRETIESE